MSRRNSLHHLYYSSHADPTETDVRKPSDSSTATASSTMLRANNLRSKSTYNLNPGNTSTLPALGTSSSKQFGSRWTLAQTESSELLQKKQEDLHNTYYNNMVMYINNKNSDNESTISGIKGKRNLYKSRESLYSTMKELREPIKESKEESEDCSACRQCDSCCDSSCCSFWSWILALLFAIFGFLGGVIVGAVVQRNGFLNELGIVLPGQNYYYEDYGNYYDDSYKNLEQGQSQNQGYSGKTRIVLPGEGEDPNRVIIPGLQNTNNFNQNGNNMYPINNNMYPNNNNMYPNNNNMYPNNNNMYPNNNNMYPNNNVDINGQQNSRNLFQNNRNNVNNKLNRNNKMYQNNRNMYPQPYPPGDPRCIMKYGQGYVDDTSQGGSCSLCSKSRLINVTGAGYADCDGLYSISNMSSIWDNKRIVYERVAGGWRPMDKRYIYWNAHFFGENFYGWSIGDTQSLSESGPFHSQGRIGASNQPWQGSWNGNASVELVTCNPTIANFGNLANLGWDRGSVRINPKNIKEMNKLRERQNQEMYNRQPYNNQPGTGGDGRNF